MGFYLVFFIPYYLFAPLFHLREKDKPRKEAEEREMAKEEVPNEGDEGKKTQTAVVFLFSVMLYPITRVRSINDRIKPSKMVKVNASIRYKAFSNFSKCSARIFSRADQVALVRRIFIQSYETFVVSVIAFHNDFPAVSNEVTVVVAKTFVLFHSAELRNIKDSILLPNDERERRFFSYGTVKFTYSYLNRRVRKNAIYYVIEIRSNNRSQRKKGRTRKERDSSVLHE